MWEEQVYEKDKCVHQAKCVGRTSVWKGQVLSPGQLCGKDKFVHLAKCVHQAKCVGRTSVFTWPSVFTRPSVWEGQVCLPSHLCGKH